jgi:hypothetical protein
LCPIADELADLVWNMWLYHLRHWISFALFVPLMLGWGYFINHILAPQGPLIEAVVGFGILFFVWGILKLTGNAT